MSATDAEPLYVVFTMDCVPPDGPAAVPGPRNWQKAERAMARFAEGLAGESLRGTFFIAPEALGRLRKTASELRAAEMELGLLCHPQLVNYQSYLGSYSYDRQQEIIRLGKAVWQDKLGEEGVCFRPGFFSANDYTFQILCMEGFSQGSCSLPGRVDPEQFSLWRESYPFAHHADPLDRKLKGTMEFYEVPATSDFEAQEADPDAETFTPPHLRIEDPDVTQEARSIINKQLNRMLGQKADVKSIVFVTHNSVGWGQKEDPHLERLHNLASLLRSIADRRKMRLVPATLAMLHEQADRLWREARGLPRQEDTA
jgi:hypothetical protein